MANPPTVWAATRIGLVRSANEDRWQVGGVTGDAADGNWTGYLVATRPWVLVADGMGGHGAGEVASSLALDNLCKSFDRDGPNDIRAAITEANWEIFNAMEESPGRRAMGTTVAGFCRDGARLSIFNVGDSRVYLLRQHRLEMISVDDTLPRRSSGRSHALTQSLGGTPVLLPLEPHLTSFEPMAGDKILVCTDGLTDMLNDQQIRETLLANASNPAATLADAAVEAGGHDNVTAVVVAF